MALARVRVELKPSKKGPEIDFKIMFQEFKRKLSDAGILTELKERQYFESQKQKNRLKLRQAIQKRKEEEIEGKLLRGERVDGSSKIVRKIRNRLKAKKLKEKQRENREHRSGNRSY